MLRIFVLAAYVLLITAWIMQPPDERLVVLRALAVLAN